MERLTRGRAERLQATITPLGALERLFTSSSSRGQAMDTWAAWPSSTSDLSALRSPGGSRSPAMLSAWSPLPGAAVLGGFGGWDESPWDEPTAWPRQHAHDLFSDMDFALLSNETLPAVVGEDAAFRFHLTIQRSASLPNLAAWACASNASDAEDADGDDIPGVAIVAVAGEDGRPSVATLVVAEEGRSFSAALLAATEQARELGVEDEERAAAQRRLSMMIFLVAAMADGAAEHERCERAALQGAAERCQRRGALRGAAAAWLRAAGGGGSRQASAEGKRLIQLIGRLTRSPAAACRVPDTCALDAHVAQLVGAV
ncbi:hypothetical protein FOA52_005699 [Chlamydomonas sp. UWO 241]|nr:hypothetical protein FOA52_005699 [Chlamydomonas sp. UWO 241]